MEAQLGVSGVLLEAMLGEALHVETKRRLINDAIGVQTLPANSMQ